MSKLATNSAFLLPAPSLRAERAFLAVCLGQMMSLFAAHLVSFVLGVWVYQQTKSATNFSLISFFAIVPEILLAPIAGILVDRWNRRWIMIGSHLGAAFCSFALILLALANHLSVSSVYAIVAASSAFQSVQYPALSALTPQLVRAQHLSRANGAVEFGGAIAFVIAPITAAAFLRSLGLQLIFLLSAINFLFAIGLLLFSDIPLPATCSIEAKRPSLLREAAQGWTFIKERREFLGLVFLFAAINFTFGTVQVLLPPLVLSFASSLALGSVMSCAGAGLMAGSLLISIWGGPQRKIRAILMLAFLQGLILFLGISRPSVWLVGSAALLFSACTTMIFVLSQTIWQTQIPQSLQGRAFAVRRLVSWSTLPIAYLTAGPLADKVFEPLLAPNGLLAGSAGLLIGAGTGRGIALLFVVMGALMVVIVCLASGYRPFRELESRMALANLQKTTEILA